MTLVTGLVRVSDRGIWEAFEKAVSNREVAAALDKEISHAFPNFRYGSPYLHCIGGEDEGTERRLSTFWCGCMGWEDEYRR